HFGGGSLGPLMQPASYPGTVGDGHGTAVFGIIFGDGTHDASAIGILPLADQGIFSGAFYGFPSRATVIGELVNASLPYKAVFKSSSRGGGSGSTTQYTAESASLDNAIFYDDLLVAQLAGNFAGTSPILDSEAVAKNALTVGGVKCKN